VWLKLITLCWILHRRGFKSSYKFRFKKLEEYGCWYCTVRITCLTCTSLYFLLSFNFESVSSLYKIISWIWSYLDGPIITLWNFITFNIWQFYVFHVTIRLSWLDYPGVDQSVSKNDYVFGDRGSISGCGKNFGLLCCGYHFSR
jgi:hypothetical protein